MHLDSSLRFKCFHLVGTPNNNIGPADVVQLSVVNPGINRVSYELSLGFVGNFTEIGQFYDMWGGVFEWCHNQWPVRNNPYTGSLEAGLQPSNKEPMYGLVCPPP